MKELCIGGPMDGEIIQSDPAFDPGSWIRIDTTLYLLHIKHLNQGGADTLCLVGRAYFFLACSSWEPDDLLTRLTEAGVVEWY